jgi:hypothetical protein
MKIQRSFLCISKDKKSSKEVLAYSYLQAKLKCPAGFKVQGEIVRKGNLK